MYRNKLLSALAAATLLFTAVEPAAAQTPLRLDEVYRATRERNPRLQAAGALVAARRALVPAAGTLPDPQVQVGAMNFSLPGFNANMPASMVPSIQVMQMLPLFGKLGLSERIADQSAQIAQADADEAWWEPRTEAAMAF